MSDVAEETTSEATAEESAPAFDPATATFEDNSRIPDAGRFTSWMVRLREACETAVAEAIAYTNTTKAFAEAFVGIRSTIMRPNSFPDWGADSDVYRNVIKLELDKSLAKLTTDSRTRLIQAVRQQVKRNYLLPGVVAYVLTTEANFGEELDKWNGEDGRDRVLSDPSQALIARVREHYNACGLDVPEGPFKEKKAAKPASPGPDADDNPTSVLETLTDALAGLPTVVPQYGWLAHLKITSEMSQQLIEGKPGAIENRAKVIECLQRIETITGDTARLIAGEVPGEEFDKVIANLTGSYFNPTTDVPA